MRAVTGICLEADGTTTVTGCTTTGVLTRQSNDTTVTVRLTPTFPAAGVTGSITWACSVAPVAASPKTCTGVASIT